MPRRRPQRAPPPISADPVALKAVAPGLVRRSDAGGVRLGLAGATAVNRAAREMAARLEAAGTPVAVELLGDVQVRLGPLAPREADGMLRDLRTFPLLDGHRGRPRADLDSLRDLVLRVGALAATLPAVAELDLDSVIPTPEGALVVDTRVRLEPPGPAAPFRSLDV